MKLPARLEAHCPKNVRTSLVHYALLARASKNSIVDRHVTFLVLFPFKKKKMITGYHWDCSDWANQSQNPLPNITEVPGSEIPDSSSFHSNESNESNGNNHQLDTHGTSSSISPS